MCPTNAKASDAVIFIDANQYLYFFRADKGKKLLDTLVGQKESIFVTDQIVDEVGRRKLQVAADYLRGKLEKDKPELEKLKFEIPDHFFGSETTTELKSKLGFIKHTFKELNADYRKAASEILAKISASQDDVSRALEGVFSKAVSHTQEQLSRARKRKERGRAPGKHSNPLGDQLSWEQLVDHCKDKSKLWIISADSDFVSALGDQAFLNPSLRKELDSDLQVFCFHSIVSIQQIAKETKISPKKPLSDDELKEIEKEIELSVPPAPEWPPPGMTIITTSADPGRIQLTGHQAALISTISANLNNLGFSVRTNQTKRTTSKTQVTVQGGDATRSRQPSADHWHACCRTGVVQPSRRSWSEKWVA